MAVEDRWLFLGGLPPLTARPIWLKAMQRG
jgi:hypothetical protein